MYKNEMRKKVFYETLSILNLTIDSQTFALGDFMNLFSSAFDFCESYFHKPLVFNNQIFDRESDFVQSCIRRFNFSIDEFEKTIKNVYTTENSPGHSSLTDVDDNAKQI